MSAPLDFFALLSIPRSFTPDAQKLEQTYFTLQRQFHPDRASGQSALERQHSMQASVRLNDAYRTLLDPLKRAEYLLSLEGYTLHDLTASPSLLGQVMEWREELSEASETALLTSLSERASAIEGECIAQLEKTFEDNDLKSAAHFTQRLSYVTKWREEIRQKLLSVKHNKTATS